MSKYVSKAEELSKRVQDVLDSFELVKDDFAVLDKYVAPKEMTDQFPDILIDTQNLLYSESPQHPVYIWSLELNDRRKYVMERDSRSFEYKDFILLRDIIAKYLDYCTLREAED